MVEIPLEYWNKLANQVIMISSLLGGFSIAVIANLLVSDLNTKLSRTIMLAANFAASFFLITVFAMTKIVMMTTTGYPLKVVASNLMFPRFIGIISFFIGIISLIIMISLAGWTKSKRMGKITTTVGIITFILIVAMMN